MLPARCCSQASDSGTLVRMYSASSAGTAPSQNIHRQPNVGSTKSRGHGSQQISHGISALQNSAENPSPTSGRRFHCERSAHSPLAAHADSKYRAQNEENCVIWRKSAEDLDHRKINDIGHEGNPAAVAVREETKQQCSDRPKRQCSCRCENDGFLGNPELPRQRVVEKNNDEKIECIQGPAEKTG